MQSITVGRNQDQDVFPAIRKSLQKLSQEFNYDCETFWNKIPKACVITKDQRSIVTATGDLIAGLFMKEKCFSIISMALDLSFYAKLSITDSSFLYEKVSRFVTQIEECEPGEVPVDFKFRGWFEKWIQKSPKTDIEKEFFDFLSESENAATICFFGPWLATLLLKLDRKSPPEVVTKITKFCCRQNLLFWKEKFSEELKLLLKEFPRVNPFKPKKDALYRAMIETSFILKDKSAFNLMYFTTLQTCQFSDMLLVKLIDCFRESRPSLKLYQIEEATRTARTAYSWDAYSNFLTLFYGGLSTDEQYYAKFAREFDFKVFSNLSYANNPILCNYLAIITDYIRKIDSSCKFNRIPSYAKLISNRTKLEPMNSTDFTFCAKAAQHLLTMESRNVQNGIAAPQNCEEKSENKKISSQAKESAQFRKTRSERIRELAEGQVKKCQGSEPISQNKKIADKIKESTQFRKKRSEGTRELTEDNAKKCQESKLVSQNKKIAGEAKGSTQFRKKYSERTCKPAEDYEKCQRSELVSENKEIVNEAKESTQFRKKHFERTCKPAEDYEKCQRSELVSENKEIVNEAKESTQVRKTRSQWIRELAESYAKKCQERELVEE